MVVPTALSGISPTRKFPWRKYWAFRLYLGHLIKAVCAPRPAPPQPPQCHPSPCPPAMAGRRLSAKLRTSWQMPTPHTKSIKHNR